MRIGKKINMVYRPEKSISDFKKSKDKKNEWINKNNIVTMKQNQS